MSAADEQISESNESWLVEVTQWPQKVRSFFWRVCLFPFAWVCRRNDRLKRFAAWCRLRRRRLTALVVLLAHTLGVLASLNVLTEPRTPQGSIAWIVSLNTCPYLAVPIYWTVGETDYGEHAIAYRQSQAEGSHILERLQNNLTDNQLIVPAREDTQELLARLVNLPVTRGNRAELLVDGVETFDAMFSSIEKAESYVLVEFYIIRDDQIGRRLKDLLIAKAREGVAVMLLYDEYGSRQLPGNYFGELRDAGVHAHGFNPPLADGSTTRLNFRNHRKLLVVDGHEAYVGGHNVGDEYVYGKDELGAYRDTHVRVEGPLVQCCQIVFGEDWHAVTGELLDYLDWESDVAAEPGTVGLCLPSGPADEFETATMFFLQSIHAAKQRVWIASPYFVPDEQMVTALQLAALRGVDVRILIPQQSDSTLVWLSSYSYLAEMEAAGVRVYKYQNRFMHQKVVLVDDTMASIGTANFDNRSFRLNFEIMLVFFDDQFTAKVAEMLDSDIQNSELASASELTDSSYLFRLLVRGSRLLAPIQ
ncbi:MAG: cardiolipin synthase [Pirellulaceae bacterium]|nr:cardiolipin synthase [Pirellulaceae bacterium]